MSFIPLPLRNLLERIARNVDAQYYIGTEQKELRSILDEVHPSLASNAPEPWRQAAVSNAFIKYERTQFEEWAPYQNHFEADLESWERTSHEAWGYYNHPETQAAWLTWLASARRYFEK